MLPVPETSFCTHRDGFPYVGDPQLRDDLPETGMCWPFHRPGERSQPGQCRRSLGHPARDRVLQTDGHCARHPWLSGAQWGDGCAGVSGHTRLVCRVCGEKREEPAEPGRRCSESGVLEDPAGDGDVVPEAGALKLPGGYPDRCTRSYLYPRSQQKFQQPFVQVPLLLT